MSNSKDVTYIILDLDIGGPNIKATVLDHSGKLLQEYKEVPTLKNAIPNKVLDAIQTLVTGFQNYDKVSVGFPGILRRVSALQLWKVQLKI